MAIKKRDPEIVAIGERIRAAREARGMTMEHLAREALISPQFLGKVEKGEQSMTIGKLTGIVLALGVSSDFILFGYDENRTPNGIAAEYLGNLTPEEAHLLSHVMAEIQNTLTALRKEKDGLEFTGIGK